MVERQLPKLHTGVRFPSPACFYWALDVGRSAFCSDERRMHDLQCASLRELSQFFIFRQKICGRNERNARGPTTLSAAHSEPVEQMAIACRRGLGTRRSAPCRLGDRCRRRFRPTCILSWQVDWKWNRPSRVRVAWWVATARLDNVAPLWSSPASRPAMPVPRHNRAQRWSSVDRIPPIHRR